MTLPRDHGGDRRAEPSLLENLEGFLRGIVEGLDEDKPPVPPGANPTDGASREVGRRVQEVRRGDYVYRRTTIDEVVYDPLDRTDEPSGDRADG
ncbi:MAG: hypothetical protein ACO31E_07020 [Phycisphaerales bacterium]|jgi:hypothetical protein